MSGKVCMFNVSTEDTTRIQAGSFSTDSAIGAWSTESATKYTQIGRASCRERV